MAYEKRLIYEFDAYQLDPAERRLFHAGRPVALPPKAFEILAVLVENSGTLVDKETLLNRVWADTFVEEGNLKLNIHTLRKTLNNSDLIETIPKKGYRLNAPVKVITKKETSELLLEKQTISKITVEATAFDEPETSVNATSFIKALVQRKVYLFALALLCLFGLAAFYLWPGRKDEKVMATSAPNGVRTVAVLPLRSLSVPPADQELRVGLADSIVTRLSAIRQLAVRPTSSTIPYLDRNYNAIEVGRELKVDSVLEGSVQKDGQKLLINLQMVSVQDGKVLWADSFTNELANALGGQESVANRVSRLLALTLNSSSPEQTTHNPANLSAQDLYLKGNYALATSARKIENILQARDFFEGAIRLDPNFALAHAELARAYTLAASLQLLSPRESYPQAERAARRALEIDPNLSLAYIALAEIESDYNYNWQSAEANNRRALELAPNSAAAHHSYSEFLARMGRFNESAYHADLAHQLDPTRINYEAVRALHHFYEHRFDDTIAQSRMVIEKDANAYLAYLYLSVAQAAKGNYAEGIEAGKRAGEITGGGPSDLFVLACNYALAGDHAKTDEMLNRMQAMSKQRYVDPFFFVVIHAYRGDKDLAFASMEKSFAEKSYWMTSIKVHPVVDSLRSDARFAEMLRKMNLDT